MSGEMEITRIITLLRHLNNHATELAVEQFPQGRDCLDSVISILHRNQLNGYFLHLVADNSLQHLLPEPQLTQVAQAAEEYAERARDQLRLLTDLKAHFEAADIPFIALKGLYISQRFYGDIGRRYMWDLDVLIEPGNLPQAVAALQEMGMTNTSAPPVDIANPWWGIHALEFRSDRGKVDIHVNLRNLPGIEIDLDQQWRDSQNYLIDGVEVPCANDENTLFLCCLGLATDMKRGRRNLRKIWDIYMMLRTMDGQTKWHDFLEQRQRDGSLKLVINILAFVIYFMECEEECPEAEAALQNHPDLLLIANRRRSQDVYEHAESGWLNHLMFSRMLPISGVQYWTRLLLTLPARQLFYRREKPKRKG